MKRGAALFLGLLLGGGLLFAQDDKGQELALFDLLELRLNVSTVPSNPYDPTEIDISAAFTAPSGEVLTVPAFFMQPMSWEGRGDPQPDGDPEWRVRFTPTQVGEWVYRVEARTSSGAAQLEEGRFTVLPAAAKGFVRTSPNQRYFAFQDGSAFFPIGQNLGWSDDLDSYLIWLDELHASGANYARVFADTAWFVGLDWGRTPGDYSDDQEAAWRMDVILEAARERGIYLQVVLIWHQAFIQNQALPVIPPADVPRIDTGADFDGHSYNTLNGGTLPRPEAFFQDSRTRTLLQHKLRYMLARWGYSPQVFAWEVVADVDRLPGFSAAQHTDYINELAAYVRELDPYAHLLTLGSRQPLPEVLQNPLYDFAQIRLYQRRPLESAPDQVASLLTALYQPIFRLDKPLLLTEFSLNPWYEPTQDDPSGVHLRNTIWAAALSNTAGGGMTQWWDTYVDRQDLYHIYTPLVNFTRDIAWHTLALEPIQVSLVNQRGEAYEPLRIDTFNRSFRGASPPDVLYRLTADGAIPDMGSMSSYLYGSGFNAEASRPQTFIITAPIDTLLRIGIRDIAPNGVASLNVTVDDQPYAILDLRAGSEGTALNIPLARGEHRLVVDNVGRDWVELDYIEVQDYRSSLRAVALGDAVNGVVLVWLQNRAYTWQNAAEGIEPEAQRFVMGVHNMPAGTYQIEFWDPFTSNILGEDVIRIDGAGTLDVPLLPVRRQLAVRIFRSEGGDLLTVAPTFVPTRTPLVTASATPSADPSRTATSTVTPSVTASVTASETPSATPSDMPSATSTQTPTPTASVTASETPSATPSDTPSATSTQTPPPATSAAASDTPSDPNFVPRQTRTPRPD